MIYPTEIFLSKSAIENNIKFLRNQFGDKVIICSVVKANAYGHGIEQFVPIVEKCGINHFATFNYDEAIRVHNLVKKNTKIMIMGWIGDDDLIEIIEKGFEFYVYELRRLRLALKISKKLNKKAKIHLEVETGLNRTGLNGKDLKSAIELIKDNRKHFLIKGVCSHLAGPESIANHVRVKQQIRIFRKAIKKIKTSGISPKYCHIACSAGAVSYPEARFDMVRIGIMQYGFWSSKETFLRFVNNETTLKDPLKRVICWKSQVMSIKEVKTGEFISYGITYLSQENKKIAIVPVGYSNGYSRSLSNHGRVLIRGVRCGIIGLVNMNMIIADVTTIDEVEIGDEVVIVGTQDDLSISVDSFSEISQLVNYEILSRIPVNIPRYVLD